MISTANHIENTIPVKKYDGKKSKNKTLMKLVVYLFQRIAGVEDVREVI